MNKPDKMIGKIEIEIFRGHAEFKWPEKEVITTDVYLGIGELFIANGLIKRGNELLDDKCDPMDASANMIALAYWCAELACYRAGIIGDSMDYFYKFASDGFYNKLVSASALIERGIDIEGLAEENKAQKQTISSLMTALNEGRED